MHLQILITISEPHNFEDFVENDFFFNFEVNGNRNLVKLVCLLHINCVELFSERHN